MENKFIGQRLADIRQRETHAKCIMQISNPSVVYSFHSQHIRKIRNGVRKHSQAFLSIFTICKTDFQGS